MKHLELELEHQYKNKFIGRRRIGSRRKLLVVGSSRSADIRLMGEDVSPVHAYIQNTNGSWAISDAGSERGTWLDKKPITAETISSPTSFVIGGHTLKLVPHETDKSLFEDSQWAKENNKGGELYHQIILKKGDRVYDTSLIASNDVFEFEYQGKVHKFAAPKKDEVKKENVGPYVVLQRLVRSERLSLADRGFADIFKNPEMRTPLIAAVLFFLGLALIIMAIPHKPEQELTEMKPDNKYTRLVFDAELMKKKREEAKVMRKTLMAKAPQPTQQSQKAAQIPSPQKAASTPPTKVVKNLKLENLSALLGKITKRANANGPMIVGVGATPETGRGHATVVAASSSLQGIATNVGSGSNTYKVGAVGTAGVGGGKGVAGMAGLANGAVGTGTVGILDEETEIEGGLDKEVIAKVIAGYLGEIRYCYERQLSAEPDIYGKVQIKFSIDSTGAVSSQRIGTSTLKSAMVEGCILRRVARWKFPLPKGGTEVLVTYPFMFKATN
jgi:outer membrane biosynthesis protein TonB/pSer/pThr/pTyr-binding forkhead associated (FHA) protein